MNDEWLDFAADIGADTALLLAIEDNLNSVNWNELISPPVYQILENNNALEEYETLLERKIIEKGFSPAGE